MKYICMYLSRISSIYGLPPLLRDCTVTTIPGVRTKSLALFSLFGLTIKALITMTYYISTKSCMDIYKKRRGYYCTRTLLEGNCGIFIPHPAKDNLPEIDIRRNNTPRQSHWLKAYEFRQKEHQLHPSPFHNLGRVYQVRLCNAFELYVLVLLPVSKLSIFLQLMLRSIEIFHLSLRKPVGTAILWRKNLMCAHFNIIC